MVAKLVDAIISIITAVVISLTSTVKPEPEKEVHTFENLKNNQETAENQALSDNCSEAITVVIQNSSVGDPPRSVPSYLIAGATTEIQRAIAAEMTQQDAYDSFERRLESIENEVWRSELASAASNIVGEPPNECK